MYTGSCDGFWSFRCTVLCIGWMTRIINLAYCTEHVSWLVSFYSIGWFFTLVRTLFLHEIIVAGGRLCKFLWLLNLFMNFRYQLVLFSFRFCHRHPTVRFFRIPCCRRCVLPFAFLHLFFSILVSLSVSLHVSPWASSIFFDFSVHILFYFSPFCFPSYLTLPSFARTIVSMLQLQHRNSYIFSFGRRNRPTFWLKSKFIPDHDLVYRGRQCHYGLCLRISGVLGARDPM